MQKNIKIEIKMNNAGTKVKIAKIAEANDEVHISSFDDAIATNKKHFQK